MATLQLIPGDDWDAIPVALTDSVGDPVPIVGTVTGIIETSSGDITLTIDPTDLVSGEFTFSAADTVTSSLPLGTLSLAKFTNVNGPMSKILFCMNIEGVLCL